ncbi:MAG: hypothetical protein HY508_00150 [Acidobacteria bacterium]|nr:hypothetical protein [Acidobacteriota bacterium]
MLKWPLSLALMVSLWGSAFAQQPPPQGPGGDWRGAQGGERVMGTVVSVGVDRLTVKTADGKEQVVMVSDQTQYRQQRKEIQLEDLKPGDHVFVAGHENADHQLAALMVHRVTDEQMQMFGPGGDRAFGEIVAIENNQIKVRNRRQGDRVVTINEQTTFMKEGKPSTLQELKVGDRIMAVGKEVDGSFTATRVMSGMMQGPWGRPGGGPRGGPGDGPEGSGPRQ